MLRLFTRLAMACSLMVVAGTFAGGSTAQAQVCCYDPCCCCPRPVVQQCYQTVPVTKYRQVKQIVQRPVCETKYIDQPCTEYRQVMENKVAQVPTCTYQPVTEYRTVQKDCGQWVTNYRCRPEVAPCQYDNRPDLFGFLNRTGYSIRMAFTPRVWAERTYVPNVVCQQVPVTRQVAVRGVRTVNYQTAKLVPVTTTRRVAVNTVRMVSQEIVMNQPYTVMKTIPMGTGLAYGGPFAPSYAAGPTPIGAGPTAITAPIPDSKFRTSAVPPAGDTISRPTPVTPRSADSGLPPKPPTRSLDGDEDDFKSRGSIDKTDGEKPISESVTPAGAVAEETRQETRRVGEGVVVSHTPKATAKRPIGRWVARKKSVQPNVAQGGPVIPMEMLVTSNNKTRNP